MLLDWLVRVGVSPKCNRPDGITVLGQGGMEELGGVRLGEEPAFEIDARRKVVEGVRWPCEAINAAMLASTIGVDRAIEADVGGAVAGYYALRPLDSYRRPSRRNAVEYFNFIEPIAVLDALLQVEARRSGVAGCTAPTVRLDWHAASLAEQ